MKFNEIRKSIRLVQFAVALAFVAMFATNALAFMITIDPGAYQGAWLVRGIETGSAPGLRTLDLAEGPYALQLSGARSFLNIAVAANGDVTSENPVAAQGAGNTLTFNNTTIFVNADDAISSWEIRGLITSSATESTPVTVVPGLTYQFRAVGLIQSFSVAEPCAVDPTQFELGGFTFDITCGQPDLDEDGVPDETDNCPNIANPNQVDQDLDGLGNLCDDDLDGDGLNNDVDNCPDIANADQADLDGDGEGDACEDDTDGDAVPDVDDNCLLVPNTDQADSDDDGEGDVCDDDDDNDGVGDEVDNCPLNANPDQADFNGNGEGDVCDGDVDGDGVANDGDLCPLSPSDLAVNADGCTGAQFIARECVQENFVQHGQYVSCVAHAANDAVDQGLITPKEKAQFVKEAAQSK